MTKVQQRAHTQLARIRRSPWPLTPRVRECAWRLLLEGKDNQNIASALTLSLGTVKARVHNIYRKANVSSRPAAAAKLLERRLKQLLVKRALTPSNPQRGNPTPYKLSLFRTAGVWSFADGAAAREPPERKGRPPVARGGGKTPQTKDRERRAALMAEDATAVAVTDEDRELATKPVHGLFVKYSLITLIGMAAQAVMVILEGVIIGNGLGSFGLAVVGIIMPLELLNLALGDRLAWRGHRSRQPSGRRATWRARARRSPGLLAFHVSSSWPSRRSSSSSRRRSP